ncbi:MAG: two-component regulator propeller domain-containing protein [Saprospiraceae bacterium]
MILLVWISSCQSLDNGWSGLVPAHPEDQYAQPGRQRSTEQISQVVRMMMQDQEGSYWFGTENGAFKLVDDSLYHMDKIRSETGGLVTIKDITQDMNGVIWIGHADGISRIQGDSVVNYYESDGLISNDVWCIEADALGKIWIGTIDGACTFDGQEFVFINLPEGEVDTSRGISSTRMVHDIKEDSKGIIWLSTNAGLFTSFGGQITPVSGKRDMHTNFIHEIFEDSQGQIWVSTKQGLYRMAENGAENMTEGKMETGKGIGSMADDKEGRLWFVSNQHQLFTFDGHSVSEFQKSEDNAGPVVFQIYRDQGDRLWFVGYGGAFRLEDGRFVNITKRGPWN